MTLPIILAAIALNVVLLVSLLVLVPRLIQRHASNSTSASARLREMLLDVLSEQEAVTLRQNQIGLSLAQVNQELRDQAQPPFTLSDITEASGLPRLEQRIDTLQTQLAHWLEQRPAPPTVPAQDAQSWGHLLGLLATMQDRIAVLNAKIEQPMIQPQPAADRLLAELESEMLHLRGLADEIASLQWKLRRSVLERETSLASLRSQVQGRPSLTNRAA